MYSSMPRISKERRCSEVWGPLAMAHRVVLVADPHEVHDLAHVRRAEGVREPEAQVLLVPGAGAVDVVRVQHHVGELDRNGLAFLDLAVPARLEVGGDLDGAAVDVEEAEAVAAAGGVDRPGVGDQLHAAGEEPLGEGVDVGGVGGAVGDEVEALVVGLAQSGHVLLGGAFGGEEGDAGVLGDLVRPQTPE
ncbi:hypothetical protein SAMN05428954_0689 [Streptomyces sp. 2112.3]|nr:hypothetical protein SAMN05428954_0689 [Streptomyces sp. 2112.3]